MRKALGFALIACAALVLTGVSAAAHPDTYTYAGLTTTDGGCAGNTWANDTVTRTWTVKRGPNTSGGQATWRVRRTDKGTFSTLAGPSPGNCAANTTPHGTAVTAGVTGKINGYASGTVMGGTYNPTATCTGSDCGSTATFLSTHFGAGATWTCTSGGGPCKFAYTYKASKRGNPTLHYSMWTDKGDATTETFTGDIATS